MSREIKFRAWNKEKKIMCYDNEDKTEEYFDGINSTEIGFINHRLSIPKDDSDWYFRSRYDVMQYTGLKDKNGKEIFEGDIVKCFKIHNSIVCMAEYAWGLKTKTLGFIPFSEIYGHFEVIGNIYENPELLEETE